MSRHRDNWRANQTINPTVFLPSPLHIHTPIQNAQHLAAGGLGNDNLDAHDDTNADGVEDDDLEAMEDVTYDENELSQEPNSMPDVDFEQG